MVLVVGPWTPGPQVAKLRWDSGPKGGVWLLLDSGGGSHAWTLQSELVLGRCLSYIPCILQLYTSRINGIHCTWLKCEAVSQPFISHIPPPPPPTAACSVCMWYRWLRQIEIAWFSVFLDHMSLWLFNTTTSWPEFNPLCFFTLLSPISPRSGTPHHGTHQKVCGICAAVGSPEHGSSGPRF